MTGSRKYNFKCQSFPNTIEQERRRRGWTVTKLAELSGVSRYSIAAYETWAAGGIVPKQQMKSVTDTTAQMMSTMAVVEISGSTRTAFWVKAWKKWCKEIRILSR